uniref:Uncharacterized protein n=1 Tax=Cannabis sativa TaxID=3483 RepID=A0A803QKS4_CANSA
MAVRVAKDAALLRLFLLYKSQTSSPSLFLNRRGARFDGRRTSRGWDFSTIATTTRFDGARAVCEQQGQDRHGRNRTPWLELKRQRQRKGPRLAEDEPRQKMIRVQSQARHFQDLIMPLRLLLLQRERQRL